MGYFLRVCDSPNQVVQGVPVRSEQITALADCEKLLFASSAVIGFDQADGRGNIKSMYSVSLKEIKFLPVVTSSLSEELVAQLCAK